MIATIFFSVVFVLLSLTVNVNSQTCENTTDYSVCSVNSECGCLSLSSSDDRGICGVITMSCSEFVPCQLLNDTCEQSDNVCVRHPRCDSRPLCYPLSMVGDSVCPPKIVSNYSSALTTDNERFARPGTSTSNYYYEAIQIIVNRTGTYDITSLSGFDTHGYLYNGTFYPYSPSTNLVYENDDGGGNVQFKLTPLLQAGVPYTLVVSEHVVGSRGPFSVVATGPGDVQLIPINPMDLTTTSTTTQPPIFLSNYSSSLTSNSGKFSRDGASGVNYYYQAIEVRVNKTGNYTFRTSSSMGDTYGYLYQGNFYPTFPSYNIITKDDDSSGNRQFQLTAALRSDITYILVFTTYNEGYTGSFSVVASGPDDVFLNRIDINK